MWRSRLLRIISLTTIWMMFAEASLACSGHIQSKWVTCTCGYSRNINVCVGTAGSCEELIDFYPCGGNCYVGSAGGCLSKNADKPKLENPTFWLIVESGSTGRTSDRSTKAESQKARYSIARSSSR